MVEQSYPIIFEMLEMLRDLLPRLHLALVTKPNDREIRQESLVKLEEQLHNDMPGSTIYPLCVYQGQKGTKAIKMINPLGVLDSFFSIEQKLYNMAVSDAKNDLLTELGVDQCPIKPSHRERRINDLYRKQKDQFIKGLLQNESTANNICFQNFMQELVQLRQKILDLADNSRASSARQISEHQQPHNAPQLCLTDWNFKDVMFRINQTNNKVERLQNRNFRFGVHKTMMIHADIYSFCEEGSLRAIQYIDVATLK